MSRDTSTIEHGEHSANWPFMSMSQWLDCLPEQAIPPIWSQYMGQRPLIIFDPEIIKETITEASKCFEEHYHCDPYPILENISTYQISQQILLSKTLDYILGGEQHEPIIKEESSDRRFKHPLWNDNPYFSYLKQSYLLTANMLNESAKFLKGIDGDNKRRFKFYMKQVIDASSPANFPATNPQVIEETVKTNGKNLMKGYLSLLEHLNDNPYSFPIRMTDPKAFNLGENIAATKGSVVFKNHLFELIHYHATKSNVGSVPLLIVPPWIKKFYIFDLQKENSFIQWMLDRGIDVFMMSWVNPDKNHADQTLENYILDGIHYAIQKIIGLKGVSRINAMGYCTGGIALTTLLAYLGKIGEDTKINSATILAAPINFDKAGDLKTFVCQRQLNLLEKYVQKKGCKLKCRGS